MVIPEFFFIGCLVVICVAELRRWIELCMTSTDDDDEKDPPMPDSVKHMSC